MNKIAVNRFKENPLITPEEAPWLKRYPPFWRSVFNCGVIFEPETGLFKMLFRGGLRIFSELGYAESRTGIKDWKIYPKPVLSYKEKFFWYGHTITGIEDPRIVKWIDGYYYIFATAGTVWYNILSGGRGGRLGIWRTKDFKNFEWVASPIKGEGKNAAIFGDVIQNKYAYLLYRKFPSIWITHTDDMSLKGGWHSHSLLLSPEDVYKAAYDKEMSPSKIGLAGPPLKTPKGWLTIFHAKFSKGRRFFYNLGFMVLALDDPTQIIYLHPEPILWPQHDAERYGLIPNVCFSCANVEKNDKIYIYWGGADTVICGGFLNKADLPMCY